MDSEVEQVLVADAPQTENRAINEVLAAVANLSQRPVDEHVGVYEEAHDVLRRGLDRCEPSSSPPA